MQSIPGGEDYAVVFGRVLSETRTSVRRLAHLSGISRRTLENWLDGTVRRPRHWGPILQVARVLHLPAVEVDALLRAAQQPSLASLHDRDDIGQNTDLLSAWSPFSEAGTEKDDTYTSARSNVPTPATKFVGREKQLLELTSLLARPDVRLVTVFGTGGIGKTRLALEVARLAADRFKNDIFFVSLEAASSAENLLDRLMLGFGIQRDPTISAHDAILAFLRERQSLVILDTFENLLPSAAFLGEVLRTAPGIKLIVTSRAVLRVTGEHVFPVPLMSGDAKGGDLATISRREDINLFFTRALAIRPDLELNADNVADILAICRMMDGLPLALELAAARTRLLPLPELRKQLEHSSGLLAGGPRDAPPRHHSIQDTISWSHDLLTPDEQMLLRRMSVYRDGCTLAAAQAVAPRPMLSSGRFLDVLTGLIDHSLISFQRIGLQHLYRMHDLTRQFAQSRLFAAGEFDSTMSRLLDFVSGPAEQVDQHARDSERSYWLSLLDPESNNVWLVLEWGVNSEQATVVEKCLRLCGVMLHYWNLRGHVDFARKWTERAIESAHRLGIKDTSQTRALLTASALALIQADGDTAAERSAAALIASREARDKAAEAHALHLLGLAAYYHGDLTASDQIWTAGLQVAEQLGDGSVIARALDDLGNLASRNGDYESAMLLHQREQEVSHAQGDLYSEFYAVLNLGDVSIRLHRLQDADRFNRRALELGREIGDIRGLAHTLITQSRLLQKLNRSIEQNELLHEALQLSWRIQNLDIVLTSLEQLLLSRTNLAASQQVQFLGLLHLQRGRYGPSSYPEDEAGLRNLIDQLKQQLGDARFRHEWELGQTLSWESAVNSVLHKDAINLVAPEKTKSTGGIVAS